MYQRSAVLADADLDRLIAAADIVIDEVDVEAGEGPELVAARAERFRRLNPRLVAVACGSFGLTGPYAGRRSSALVDWAMSGYAAITGDPDREPLQGGGPWCAYVNGLTAAVGAMAALRTAERTGRGQLVDVAAMDAMTALHQWTIILATHQGVRKRRSGNRHAESFHPLGILPCKDGAVAIAVSSPAQWEGFCLALGMPELLGDGRFATGGDRFDRADELDALILPWLLERSQRDIVELLQDHNVPTSPVLDVLSVQEDEQLADRGFWQPLPHLGEGVVAPSLPVRGPVPPKGRPRAPDLGEDTANVLAELGTAASPVHCIRGCILSGSAPGGSARRRTLDRLGGTARRPLLRRSRRRRCARRAPRIAWRQPYARRCARARPRGLALGRTPPARLPRRNLPRCRPRRAPLEPQRSLQQVSAQQALPLPRPEGRGRARGVPAAARRSRRAPRQLPPSCPRPAGLRLRDRYRHQPPHRARLHVGLRRDRTVPGAWLVGADP